jgi:arginine decarboxylase
MNPRRTPPKETPPTSQPAETTDEHRWTVRDAAELYGVDGWGNGYVTVNRRGNLVIRPDRRPGRTIDLHEVIQGLDDRGITTPVLVRFKDIIANRIAAVHDAFAAAIEEHEYTGAYRCVYPIKVNQQRHVVRHVQEFGHSFGFGLEAGSKPELLAVLALTADHNDQPIICNGFKDSEFIETVILATKLGRRIIPVVEKFSELELIVKHATRYDVRPTIGVRAKLSSHGAGRWVGSSGVRSKFGLHVSELVDAVAYLDARGMKDCLQLLHCHVGSQIFDIRAIKNAITELTHIYIELHRLGAAMGYIDIGGGLGIDYDGSSSSKESSLNYTLDEYAADIVYRVGEACTDADVPHPTIVSESGRALTAYHSVLVFDVVGTASFDAHRVPDSIEDAAGDRDPQDLPQPLWDLFAARAAVADGDRRLEEALHDASQAHDEAMNLFRLGYMRLADRGIAERLYWTICADILRRGEDELDERPEEMERLADQMSDLYFCNLSVFQSLPDSWAIEQLFPIMPIHRLKEEPTRRAILADITCDSEGKVDRFVTGSDIRRTLPLHEVKAGKAYYLAAFLVGAYQETLGDLHNLFGDTHAVHIGFDEDGEWAIEELIPGDTVREVLSYVQFDPERLHEALRHDVERAVRRKRLTVQEGRLLMNFYQHGLDGYTYLEE